MVGPAEPVWARGRAQAQPAGSSWRPLFLRVRGLKPVVALYAAHAALQAVARATYREQGGLSHKRRRRHWADERAALQAGPFAKRLAD